MRREDLQVNPETTTTLLPFGATTTDQSDSNLGGNKPNSKSKDSAYINKSLAQGKNFGLLLLLNVFFFLEGDGLVEFELKLEGEAGVVEVEVEVVVVV